MTKTYCVYRHTAPNGVSYIGMTSNIEYRDKQHQTGISSSSMFQNALKEHGWENFTHEILHKNLTYSEAMECEKKEIIQAEKSGLAFNLKQGRPSLPKEEHRQSITIRLPHDLMDYIKNLSRNVKSAWIERAIREQIEKENPRDNG